MGSVKKQRKIQKKDNFSLFFYTANQSKSLHNMVLYNSYYFTSKIEIKPQRFVITCLTVTDYFTSKIEIKPQLMHFHQLKTSHNINSRSHYFYFLKKKILILYNYYRQQYLFIINFSTLFFIIKQVNLIHCDTEIIIA